MSDTLDWARGFPAAITVCDRDGIILEMNDKAKSTFSGDMVGKNVLDCHPEPARTKLAEMMAGQRTNVYTSEKNGVKRLIYQSPWFRDGEYRGFVELSLEVPFEMPHFVRTGK